MPAEPAEPALAPAPDGAGLPRPLDLLFIGADADGHVAKPTGDPRPAAGDPA